MKMKKDDKEREVQGLQQQEKHAAIMDENDPESKRLLPFLLVHRIL